MSLSTTITPSVAWPDVKTFADGDDADGTNFSDMAQRLANRDQLLYEKLFPLSVCVPLVGHPVNGIAEYDYTAAAGVAAYESQTTNASEYLDLELADLPEGGTITDIYVGIEGTGAYAGTPGTVNAVTLYARIHSTGVAQSYDSAQDPATFGGSPDMTDYREIHITGLSKLVAHSSWSYFLRFEHESGANAQAGVQVQSIKVTMTRPTS